jgi:hypothetical protein
MATTSLCGVNFSFHPSDVSALTGALIIGAAAKAPIGHRSGCSARSSGGWTVTFTC